MRINHLRSVTRRGLLGLSVVAMLLATTACGSDTTDDDATAEPAGDTATDAADDPSTPSDDGSPMDDGENAELAWDSLEELEAAAEAEGGEVNVYMSSEYSPVLAEPFMEKYPFATIRVTDVADSEALRKYSAERDAGIRNTDILVLGLDSYHPMIEMGAAAKLTVPNSSLIAESVQDPDGYTNAINNLPLAMLYNTALVDEGPPSLAALAEPEWADQLVMANPAEGGAASMLFATQREVMGDDAWREWLEGIAANNPTLTGSSSEAYATVLRGDRPVCICSWGDYVSQDENAPMAPVFYNQADDETGMGFNPNFAIVPTDAPNPASAALFINWVLDPEGGQVAFVESGRAPALPASDVEGGEDVGLPADVKGAKMFELMGDFIADPGSFLQEYQGIFG